MQTTIHSTADLGKAVQTARKAQNLTQDDLAGITGTGRRFISDLENGKATAQLGKTLHVLSRLGIAVWIGYTWG